MGGAGNFAVERSQWGKRLPSAEDFGHDPR
jgi:hypothetical protein